MAISGKDRARANRARKAVRDGRATPAQRAFLAEYGGRAMEPSAEPALEPSAEPALPVELRTDVEPGMVAVAFDADPIGAVVEPSVAVVPRTPTTTETPTEGPHGQVASLETCGDPKCPACAAQVGGRLCIATNKIVWDAMDPISAEGMAAAVLTLVSVVASFLRSDRKRIAPSAADRKTVGQALARVTYRRFNGIGAYDDLIMLAASLGGFAMKAITSDAT